MALKEVPGDLVVGDFWESMGTATHAPDLIFLDMFSDLPEGEREAFERAIVDHPQFRV